MSNLTTKTGENNCYWNHKGKCIKNFYNKVKLHICRRNCTFTQDGAQALCSGYYFKL